MISSITKHKFTNNCELTLKRWR